MKSKILLFLLIGILFIGKAASGEVSCQPVTLTGTVSSPEGPIQGASVKAAINGQVVGYSVSNSTGRYVISIRNTTFVNESSVEVNLMAIKEDKTGSKIITISCGEEQEVDIVIPAPDNESHSTGGDTNTTTLQPVPQPQPAPSNTTPAVKSKTSETGLVIISPSKIKSDEKIEIQVKYEDKAAANAKVTITLPNGNTLDEETDENGTLVTRLQPGDATINVEANGMNASKKITVEGGGFPYLWLIIIVLLVLILGYVIFKRMQ